MKFAAIDVGSNAVRLLLKRVIQDGDEVFYKKESLIRMPIRLGEDVFINNRISEEKTDQLLSTIKGFSHLIDAYEPLSYLACATSAMREALNGPDITELIKKETGIDVQIIDGQEEAEIIYNNHMEKSLNSYRQYIYIDVGGGSTELTLFADENVVKSRSFRIGTIRMLKRLDIEREWMEMKSWVKKVTKPYSNLAAIGSGGNINKIFRLARSKDGAPITKKKIRKIKDYLNRFNIKERIKILRLRPDRADVIIPATEVYLSVISWAKVKQMYVPQIGLADGIIHKLYDEYINGINLFDVS